MLHERAEVVDSAWAETPSSSALLAGSGYPSPDEEDESSADPDSTIAALEPPPPPQQSPPRQQHANDAGAAVSMNDEGDDQGDEEEQQTPCAGAAVGAAVAPAVWSACSPRQQRRRVQAQPVRLNAAAVRCYRYAQGRTTVEGSGAAARWQGRDATLHYFLPEGWSPSYKFTVFEDSYVLSFRRAADDVRPLTAYHLARPLHGARSPEGETPALLEFELVWPVELDAELLKSVEAACDRVVPGAKRKPQEPQIPFSLHLKLQRLEV